MISLKGKNALVTGASRGIGLEIADKLASLGANLFLNDIDEDSLKTAEKSISAHAVKVVWATADVSNEQAVVEMAKTAEAELGKIDIVVNNAGITRDGLLMRMGVEDWDAVMAVNLRSAFLVAKALVRTMMKNRSGRIVNIASVVGQIGNAGQTNYSASKGGLIAFTKSLAREVASRGITVNAVAPGFIKTDMTDKLSEEVKKQLLETIPLRQLGEAVDIANAVAYLSSDEAKYITGAVLPINGGMAM